jgi:hypothetical protein
MRMVMYSVCSLTYSYLIVIQSCERTYKFNWRSQSAIHSYEISFIEVKVECHVLLVVGVK